jgi:hypothetical protein
MISMPRAVFPNEKGLLIKMIITAGRRMMILDMALAPIDFLYFSKIMNDLNPSGKKALITDIDFIETRNLLFLRELN